MPRLLKLDPRPPAYESLAEADLEAEIGATVIADVEMPAWAPVAGKPPASGARFGFVDGVQRLERRVSAEGDGPATPGIMVAYAAGAAVPGEAPAIRHVEVRRTLILARGMVPDPVTIRARNTELRYEPASSASQDFEGLNTALNERRAELERAATERLLDEGLTPVIVDGRLPLVRGPHVAGMIKTLRHLYVSEPAHLDCLANLVPGERSPVFVIERPRPVYSWFVCLAPLRPLSLAYSNLARLEVDGDAPAREVFRAADTTAAELPRFASSPHHDQRAPQNLLPISQLERELRHRLGDPEFTQRLVVQAFSKEAPGWRR